MRKSAVFLFYLLWLSSPAFAISKEDLKAIPADQKEKVFSVFSRVKLHYLVTSNGDSLVEQVANQPKPGISLPSGFFIRLYIYPELAEEFRRESEKRDGHPYVIRTTTMDKILLAQYNSIGRPHAQTLADEPEFVIYEDWTYAIFEIFIETSSAVTWTTQSVEGRRFIPAFISEDAIAFQKKMDMQKYTRWIMVERYASSETPVLVYGYGEALDR